MSIIDSVLSRLGYVKAKQNYPEWALQRADVEGYTYPDYVNAADKVGFYKKVGWVNTAVNAVATIGSGAKWSVKSMNGEKVTDIPNHDFERKLKQPNPTMSAADLIYSTLAYLVIGVPAYWWLNIVNGKPAEIWVIPSKQISPIPDGNMYIKDYEYDPGDGQIIHLSTAEVVPFVGFSPDSMFETFSPLESLRTISNSDIGMQKWNEKLFVSSNGRLPGILAFADPLSNTDWELIQNDVAKAAQMRNFMMLRNVRAGGVQWLQATASQKDMEFLNSRLANRDEIWGALAPGLASLLSVNASLDNARTGKATLIDLKVYPLLQKIAAVVTNRIMPFYGENLVFEPEDIRITDKVLLMQEIKIFSETHKVNEVREKYWQSDPIPDELGEMLVSTAQGYKPGEQAQPPAPQITQFEPEEMPEDEQEPMVEDDDTTAQIMPVKADIYPAMLELEKWERKTAKGKPLADFIAYNIPAEVVTAIKAGLSFADARTMLQGQPEKPKPENKEIKNLVDALGLTVKAMEMTAGQPAPKAEPMSVTIHNHPGEAPQVKADFAPIVNIPAPIVNVSPAPAPVVNNVVNVPDQPAPTVNVNIPEREKRSARVTRGADGKIDGIDEL